LLILAQGGSEWLASRPGSFTLLRGNSWLEGFRAGLNTTVEDILGSAGLEPRLSVPKPSLQTDLPRPFYNLLLIAYNNQSSNAWLEEFAVRAMRKYVLEITNSFIFIILAIQQ
jgi:hypothetical protein